MELDSGIDSTARSGWRVAVLQAALAVLLLAGGLLMLRIAPHVGFWLLVAGLISTLLLIVDIVNLAIGAGRTAFTTPDLLDDDSPSRGLWDETSVYHDHLSD